MTRDPSVAPSGVGSGGAAPPGAATEPEASAQDDAAPRAASDAAASPDPAADGVATGPSPTPEAGDGAAASPLADEREPEAAASFPAEEREPEKAPEPGEAPGVAAAADEPVDPALAALREQAARAEEYLALARRTKADFENYRRRAVRDAALAQERGVARLAKELLPAVDNLDRALSAAQTAAAAAGEGDEIHAQLLSGIGLVHADVISALQRAGIEAFSPEGEAFDPQWHEAVAQAPIPDAEPGSVVEVYQRGYRIGESVLRPARVLVAA